MFIGKKLNVPGQRDLSYAALIVLKAINDFPAGGYGYNLMQALNKKYDWAVKSGTVYPILKRLLDKKFVTQKEGESRKKLYLITPLGHELLKSLETELKIIDVRASPDGWDSNVILDKFCEHCEQLVIDAQKSGDIEEARQELQSLKNQIANLLELIDNHLQAMKLRD